MAMVTDTDSVPYGLDPDPVYCPSLYFTVFALGDALALAALELAVLELVADDEVAAELGDTLGLVPLPVGVAV